MDQMLLIGPGRRPLMLKAKRVAELAHALVGGKGDFFTAALLEELPRNRHQVKNQ